MKLEKVQGCLENQTTSTESTPQSTNGEIVTANGTGDGVTENEEYFFEGTEKLLEVWFSSSTPDLQKDLFSISQLAFDVLKVSSFLIFLMQGCF